jgi:hypothetical protein
MEMQILSLAVRANVFFTIFRERWNEVIVRVFYSEQVLVKREGGKSTPAYKRAW